MTNDLTISDSKNIIISKMPKRFSTFKQKLIDVWKEDTFIEVVFNNKTYFGQCFVDKEKKEMWWHPQGRWYVNIPELDMNLNYDLLYHKPARLVPTDIQLNTYYETELKKVMKCGKFHLREMQKAYLDLQQLKKLN